MRRHRLGILLFLPLGFQLGLAARAITCVNDQAAGKRTTVNEAASMPGMDMPAPSPVPGGSGRDGDRPDGPSNPVDCQSLAGCAAAVVAPPSPAMPAAAPVPIDVVALVVLTPPSWTMRPELPPPRA